MAAKQEPLFEIDLGRNGGSIKFRTMRSVTDWAKREYERWEWLMALPEGDGLGNLPNHVRAHLGGIRQWAQDWEERGSFGNEDPAAVISGHFASHLPNVFHSKA